MSSDTKTLISWIEGFRRGHDRLEALRIKEIRESDIVTSIASFEGAFESALFLKNTKPISGLVELNRILTGGK